MTQDNGEGLSYREKLALIRQGLHPKTTGPKEKKPLRQVSEKKKKEKAELKAAGSDGQFDLFFSEMRKSMTGKCLFCSGKSMKHDDEKFHFSLAHLLPKAIFRSVAAVPENIIELCFWNNSCHSQFDNGKITWLMLKDSKEWDIIKEKLLVVLPMVAMEERKNKLYGLLESLVYSK